MDLTPNLRLSNPLFAPWFLKLMWIFNASKEKNQLSKQNWLPESLCLKGDGFVPCVVALGAGSVSGCIPGFWRRLAPWLSESLHQPCYLPELFLGITLKGYLPSLSPCSLGTQYLGQI